MNTRGRWLLSGAGIMALSWAVLQLFLTHRLAASFFHESVTGCARFVREHPSGTCQPLAPVSANDWLPYAVTSIVVLLALAGVAALLVRGGQRRWTMLVAALPAANLLGGWHDPRLLGAGWTQLSGNSLTRWLVVGSIVDTLVVVAVAAAFAVALRPVAHARPGRGLLRVIPPMLVLAGWWVMRHPLPTRVDEIWLVQALAFVLAAALLSISALHPRLRAVGVLIVLPLCTLPIYSEAVGLGSFTSVGRRALFAFGTAAMVIGLPRLVAPLRDRDAGERPAAATAG